MVASEQLALVFSEERFQPSTDDLPDGWRVARFDEVCQINPSRKGRTNYSDDLPVTFVSMAAVDEVIGTIASPEIKPYSAVKKGYTWFLENDVLFAKITPCMQNGKAAVAKGLSNGIGFGSTEFHVLRPGPSVLPEWVHLFVRQPSFRAAAAQHFTGSVGQQRVPESFLSEQWLPVPPLFEQRRVVARVEELAARIERARGLRRDANQAVEAALPAALQAVFETAVRESQAVPLGQLVDTKSGGTPSTQNPAYWGGTVPWVTPKDMKRWEIADSEDHITPEAVQQSSLNWIDPGAVLVVTRGMILARTVPVAVTQARVTINQDMKALCPRSTLFDGQGLVPEYLAYALRAAEQEILARVETAGHGTRRLPTEVLADLTVPFPPSDHQREVVAYLDRVRAKSDALKLLQVESSAELNALLPSVLERAFQGEL